MPGSTILDIPPPEQEWMLAEVRHARHGYLLAWHVLLLCAAGRTPTEIATFLFCSRSSVYRIVNAYHAHRLDAMCDNPPPKAAWLSPSLRRSLGALLTKVPSAYGCCCTRWSCATLVAQLMLQRGIAVSASTMRRWLHALGKVGYQWMLKGETVKIVTPGQNQKHYLAGALEPRTGRLVQCTSARKTNALFRALLDRLEWLYPKAQFTKVYVVVDNYGIHKAKAVERWLAVHPRFELLFLPTYCPKANPIERAFGDVHDKCTRNHQRTRIEDLVWDVEQHLLANGPWQYQLSQLYYSPEVTAAVKRITQKQQLPQAA